MGANTLIYKTDIREYTEEMSVSVEDYEGRVVVKALNEGGYNYTLIDLLDLLSFVKREMPSLLENIE